VLLIPMVFSGSVLAAVGRFEGSFGPDGSTASHFLQPAAVGVDELTGDVYVQDAVGGTVEKFDLTAR
jgi:hypothetical protein